MPGEVGNDANLERLVWISAGTHIPHEERLLLNMCHQLSLQRSISLIIHGLCPAGKPQVWITICNQVFIIRGPASIWRGIDDKRTSLRKLAFLLG